MCSTAFCVFHVFIFYDVVYIYIVFCVVFCVVYIYIVLMMY